MRQLILSSFLALTVFAVTAAEAQAEKSCDRLVELVEEYAPMTGMHPLPLNPDQARAMRRAEDQTACRDVLPRIEAATQAMMRPPPEEQEKPDITVETVPVSQIKEKTVLDKTGREVGEVERVIMGKADDGSNQLYAVVGIGGFLGIIGERKVAIALDQFALKDGTLIVPGMSEEELKTLSPWERGEGEEITGDRTAQITIVQ